MSFDIGVAGALEALAGLLEDLGRGVSLLLDFVLGRDRGTAKFSLFSSRLFFCFTVQNTGELA